MIIALVKFIIELCAAIKSSFQSDTSIKHWLVPFEVQILRWFLWHIQFRFSLQSFMVLCFVLYIFDNIGS